MDAFSCTQRKTFFGDWRRGTDRLDSSLKIRYEPGGLTFVKNRVGCPKMAEQEIDLTADAGLEEGLRRLIEWRTAYKEEVMRRRRAFGRPLIEIHYSVPLHGQPAYAAYEHDAGLPVSESAASRVISLPMHRNWGQETNDHVAAVSADRSV